jgi:DNA modification methylase
VFRILEGDALDKVGELHDSSIDMVFTSPDPPVFDGDIVKLVDIFGKIYPKLKDTGSAWVQLGDYHYPSGKMTLVPERFAVRMATTTEYILRSKLVWHRPDNSRQEDITRFKRDWEMLFFYTKMPTGYYFINSPYYYRTSVWKYPYREPEPGEFATGFPQGLINTAILATCVPGGTVLDPFCDSGTTGVCALKLGRDFVGIEIESEKIARIEARLGKVIATK